MSRKSDDDKGKWFGQSDPMADLALTIKTLRDELQLTQEELGRIVGVSRAAVSAWENGGNLPRGKRLQKLATALGTTVPDMMAGKPRASQRRASAVIAIQSDGSELPLVMVKSVHPVLWAKTRTRVIVIEEQSGHRFGLVANDETMEALTNCLEVLRELL